MASRRHATAKAAKPMTMEWSAKTVATKDITRVNARDRQGEEPIDLILSSNWVLGTEGVRDFYEVLYQSGENLEVGYDTVIQGFRIKCLACDEMRLVTLVKGILDQLVQKEAQEGLNNSDKIISLENWRKKKHKLGREIKVSERYTFPYDVAMCVARDVWDIPDEWFKKGITTKKVLPESMQSKVQRLTGAALISSTNGRTIYVGASGVNEVNVAKEKLDKIALYFWLKPKDITQVVKIFFYHEGDRSGTGEYRYLADRNYKLLGSYILDRFDWPHTDVRYPAIFHRGVIVRLNPKNESLEETSIISDTILPIVKDPNAMEDFGAFGLKNWIYPIKHKAPSPSLLECATSTARSSSNYVIDRARSQPHIETWVCSLPVPNTTGASPIPQIDSPTDIQESIFDNSPHEILCLEHHGKEPEQLPQPSRLPHLFVYDQLSQSPTPNPPDTEAGLGSVITQPTIGDDLLGLTSLSRAHGPDAITSLTTNSRVGIATPDESIINKTAGYFTDLADSPTSGMAAEQQQSHKPDPFAHIWDNYRALATKQTLGPRKPPNNKIGQGPLSNTNQSPQIYEQDSRSFHLTMNQKAGSRNKVFPEFDPNMMAFINKSIVCLMAPLRLLPGTVDLKIDLGRFCFLNVKKSQVQRLNDDDDEKYYKLDYIQAELNKRHTTADTLLFTRILTSLGADANYIARMSDDSKSPMWKRPIDGRSSIYEFTCRSKAIGGADLNFIVEIDATKFTSRVRQFEPDRNFFAVHCPRRVWDFQLMLSSSKDLDIIYRRFAEDLLLSLQVKPIGDRLPEIQISYDQNYSIEILVVRIRNIACCTSETNSTKDISTQPALRKDIQKMYISEVWEMDLINKVDDKRNTQLTFARNKGNSEYSDIPLVWYEVSLKSDILSTAFEENAKLELGNEVKWTTEDLLKSGAIEELIRKAAYMVKNMDGVGYWNDNRQKELLHGIVQAKGPKKGQYVETYW
ncbi:hypothetical protein SAMD00023353_0100730 [Rosellinia necatrix]|uniref:DUF7905 domain-containing protein n=1 Tax=Rosellinia necatrix TaxID=77044 RepID=A0A1S7UJS1_ROSNE|nr:hypothetical protein SAMD00023353_0100730 [Rosellinia necatrix]